MNLNRLIQAAIFSSISIGLGFMFMFIPNVEFITVTVFLSGFTLGTFYGGLVGSMSMMIYSVMNPIGSGLIYITLLIGQILAMMIIGIIGSFSKLLLKNQKHMIIIVVSGILGFICTLFYDGITTLAYPVSAGYNWEQTIAYAISGLLFTFFHMISNIIIFSIVVPAYIKRKESE